MSGAFTRAAIAWYANPVVLGMDFTNLSPHHVTSTFHSTFAMLHQLRSSNIQPSGSQIAQLWKCYALSMPPYLSHSFGGHLIENLAARKASGQDGMGWELGRQLKKGFPTSQRSPIPTTTTTTITTFIIGRRTTGLAWRDSCLLGNNDL